MAEMESSPKHTALTATLEDDIREKWESEQEERKRHLLVEDTEPWARRRQVYDPDDPVVHREEALRYVAGVDISFIKGDDVNACAAVVIVSLPDLEVVHKELRMIELTEPYIPGFLAFREMPSLADMVKRMLKDHRDIAPQAIMVDGNGILHPKRFGSACHLGLETATPCIGVAKHLFHVDGLANDDEHKQKIKTLLQKGGDTFPLVTAHNDTLGMAFRSSDSAPNPIYVSPGHKISLETAVWVVQQFCKHRIPEPVRQADILSREYLRDNFPPPDEKSDEKTEQASKSSPS